MTSPVPHDHPDWARTVSAATIEVIDVSVAQNAASEDRGRFFVGNTPYLWVWLAVNGGGARLNLQWYTQETGGIFMGVNTVDTRVGIPAQGPLRVLGPWVQIVTLVDATPRTVTLKVVQAFSDGVTEGSGNHNQLISIEALNVGAGATQVANPTRVRWGWGWWQGVFDTGTAIRVTLYAVDYLGNRSMLAVSSGDVVEFYGTVIQLPRAPIQIEYINADAGAHFVWVAVLYHPGPM
jgi:hypothetical protein